MFSLGAVSFAQPWALTAMLLLPAIWLLLRMTPPAPLSVRFPPVRLLAKLNRRDESPATTPLWVLILRMLLALALITGLAHPLLNASTVLRGQGPLILVIDDGWAAAANWRGRQGIMKILIDQAEREQRAVIAVTTAPAGEENAPPKLNVLRATEAGKLLSTLQPKPWPTNRKAALEPLFALDLNQPGHVAWLSDGLEEGGAEQLANRLSNLGTITIFTDPPDSSALVLMEPQSKGAALAVTAARAQPGAPLLRRLNAIDNDGRLLGGADLVFAQGERLAKTQIELPAELRNRLARLEIEDENTAAGVILIDERWRRHPVGLLSEDTDGGKPLLSGSYYIERALSPFNEIRKGGLGLLLERELSVLILDDPGRLDETRLKKLETWIAKGGVALRFAGPKLEQNQGQLSPVKLRQGGRFIGGAMSWSKPAALAPFDLNSPFHGLSIPADVKVRRQVLARPLADLEEKTWARLTDGTPLVTAEKRGEGWLILVHVTAGPNWSNLPLSGLFVKMLQRIVALSRGVEADLEGTALQPLQTLDGFGRLGSPPSEALAVPAKGFSKTPAGPTHPPGFYGPESHDNDAGRRALNLAGRIAQPRLFSASGVERMSYATPGERDMRPGLLALALLLLALDLIASLHLRGLLRPQMTAPSVALILAASVSQSLAAGDVPPAATLETRLAYIITEDKRIDEISLAGLRGLGVIVNRRTTAELGEPIGVNPNTDELSFYPLIYWPATVNQRPLSPKAAANLNAYLSNGGAIVFDGRDSGVDLKDLTVKLDIPALEPITLNHVLARSFYLLKEFPGRWNGGNIWVERAGERINDGVSSIIAGDHDWVGAWAMDDMQRPLFMVTPGGEKQREMAYRFGVNLVMYVLTGNYKADQIHLPAILERLGQ